MKEFTPKITDALDKNNSIKGSVIQYKNKKYWVLTPQKDIRKLAKRWDFLKLITFTLVEQDNELILLKKDKWFRSTDIIEFAPDKYKKDSL
ncbi:hypothetical protein E0712_09130 [Lactobacillus helveticus]|uniref:hypothetical protein n=1 Tax=Lactobacillus helveticus TaxID=1587 RepID=UPI001C6486E4|nr:hypothetical protein [Lactobacillus helveticus]MBW8014511.1 hypothetical protein [Lactobacillus helveticus]